MELQVKSVKKRWALILFVFLSLSLPIHFAEAALEYLPAKSPHLARGITVVVHGLNLKPSKMLELAKQLNSMDQDVILVTLAGHGDDEKEFGSVTRERWLSDVSEAFKNASERAKPEGLPVHFLGFSVGGLLGVDLLTSGKAQFSKMILLAPALQVHARTRLIRLARVFGKSFVIPSRSPKDYRAHRGTTVAAYESLFESLDALESAHFGLANVPTRVFIDPSDELVSTDKIEEMIETKNLSNWKFLPIDASQSQTEPKYHHLIVDPKSLGEMEWQRLIKEIRAFL